jgi:hypothetical protein
VLQSGKARLANLALVVSESNWERSNKDLIETVGKIQFNKDSTQKVTKTLTVSRDTAVVDRVYIQDYHKGQSCSVSQLSQGQEAAEEG